MASRYLPRIVDDALATSLQSAGAVLIEGPRACGKTATGRHHAASEILLDVDAGVRRAAELEPRLALEGPAPRLLDEWQSVPSIWNHVRRAVDTGGRFILTGSAVPPGDTTRHTGAGRVSRLAMRPMSLFESGHSARPVIRTRISRAARTICEQCAKGGAPSGEEGAPDSPTAS